MISGIRQAGDTLNYWNGGGASGVHAPVRLQALTPYSFTRGGWHFVALPDACYRVSGCDGNAVTTATPFTGGDEPLKTAVDGANAFLATPDLVTAPAVADALQGRIRDAFARVRRAVPSARFPAMRCASPLVPCSPRWTAARASSGCSCAIPTRSSPCSHRASPVSAHIRWRRGCADGC